MSFLSIASDADALINKAGESFSTKVSDIKTYWEGKVSDKFKTECDTIIENISRLQKHMTVYVSVGEDLDRIKEIDAALSENYVLKSNLGSDADTSWIDSNIAVLNKARKDLIEIIRENLYSIILNDFSSLETNINFSENYMVDSGTNDVLNETNTTVKDQNGIYGEVNTDSVAARTSKPSRGDKFYTSKDNPYAASNFSQCTCYAYGRFNEIADSLGTKKFSGASFGNGGDFCYSNRTDRSNANKEGFDVTPASEINSLDDLKPGDLLCWSKSGSYGHVGIVEKVEDGKVMISNGNAKQFNMYYTTVESLKGFNMRGTYQLKGVVHQTKEDD